VRIEILFFEGCPNIELAHDRVNEALRIEKVFAEVANVVIATPDDSKTFRFLGSPSIRINGSDVEPGADHRMDFGFMCRTYRAEKELTSAPSVDMIRNAIRRHIR
jgi:hypothetical protein